MHLANTTAIKKYDGLKHSGDEADARYLAHLLRLGILPTGTILPPEHRAIRDLARKRTQLVRSRTSHILAVENITARQYGARMTSNQVKQLTAEMVDELPLPMDVSLAVKTNVAVITTLSAQIELLEKRLLSDMKERPAYALLTSVPGIGKFWQQPSCWKQAQLSDSRAPATLPPTHAASIACTPAMARRREKAIQRTATSTSPGRLWRLDCPGGQAMSAANQFYSLAA